MAIEITITEEQNVMVFDVNGSVNSVTAIKLGEELQRASKKDKHHLVLVLNNIDYLTSAGLREIMSALQHARGHGGDVRLAEPAKQVKEVLEMTGLDSQIKIFATRDEAVQSFA